MPEAMVTSAGATGVIRSAKIPVLKEVMFSWDGTGNKQADKERVREFQRVLQSATKKTDLGDM